MNPIEMDSVLTPMNRSLLQRLSVFVVVAGLAVAFSACSSSKSKGADKGTPGATISIANFKFSEASAAAGSTVTVSNNDTTKHTVTADDGSFNVSVDPGKTATFTAPSTAGAVKFHCNIHSTMHGTLTVT
jgi:plastocyanin